MELYLNLEKYQRAALFKTVKTPLDMVEVYLSVLEYIQHWTGNKQSKRPYLHVDLDKTKRVYLVDVDKIISFGFDLNIKVKNVNTDTGGNYINGVYLSHYNITPKEVSEAKQLLYACKVLNYGLYLDAFDDTIVISDAAQLLFEHLISFEWGYVRYDHDSANVKVGIHPEYHLDVNFSKISTYKFELNNKMKHEHMIDIFDKTKNCAKISL